MLSFRRDRCLYCFYSVLVQDFYHPRLAGERLPGWKRAPRTLADFVGLEPAPGLVRLEAMEAEAAIGGLFEVAAADQILP